MKLFKFLLVLVGLMTLTASCEDEFSNQQQIIDSLLYQNGNYFYHSLHPSPMEDREIIALKTDVRAVWTYRNDINASDYSSNDEYENNRRRVTILDVNIIRNELQIDQDGDILYNGEKVFAVEDVTYLEDPLSNELTIAYNSENEYEDIQQAIAKIGGSIVYSFDLFKAVRVKFPLGVKAIYAAKYLKSNLKKFNFIEINIHLLHQYDFPA